MKRLLRLGILCGALALLLCVSAFAEDVEVENEGVYGISAGITAPEGTVTYKVTVNESETDVNLTKGGETDYYETAKLNFVTNATDPSKQYLLIVQKEKGAPTRENIVYIDQKAGLEGGQEFLIYPKEWDTGTYYVYLTASDATGERTPTTTFNAYVSFTLGYVNEDKLVDSRDALAAMQIYAHPENFTKKQIKAANVNGDYVVDSRDALLMMQRYAKGEALVPFYKAGSQVGS